jgi:hypothetical protein
MTTLTIKINERTKAGKAFMAMSESFFKGVKGIEIIETDSNKIEESPYDPEFVKMIQERFADVKSGKSKTITLDSNDVWGSLGLK